MLTVETSLGYYGPIVSIAGAGCGNLLAFGSRAERGQLHIKSLEGFRRIFDASHPALYLPAAFLKMTCRRSGTTSSGAFLIFTRLLNCSSPSRAAKPPTNWSANDGDGTWFAKSTSRISHSRSVTAASSSAESPMTREAIPGKWLGMLSLQVEVVMVEASR